eukprot:NODE_650_length_763_cov_51.911765_g585_i0.p1 GENE.NODE_650_length_763_cov_51.911765_g585_i0~~NODE_650_length_763_cov_51.911765_g585_i0.p1  ORF type:complete len:167 (-),score=39.02 NODE_650_length_763_cov_51.911765_g585_i0:224-724(-)
MGEPAAKRQKPNYTFNVNLALDKAHEVKTLHSIVDLPPSALQGLADRADPLLKAFKITTIAELGSWKFFLAARAIAELAPLEEDGKRATDNAMNVNKVLDKAWETKSLKEILAAPPSAFEGLADWCDSTLADLGIKSVGDLANWKYARWAESLVVLAKYESLDHSS